MLGLIYSKLLPFCAQKPEQKEKRREISLDSIIGKLLLQVVLIALNAFFAATEMAVVSLNATKLRKLEEEGDKKAAKLLKLVDAPSSFLSTIQIAITLAGLFGQCVCGGQLFCIYCELGL